MTAPVVIKKYGNRRLYDTEESRYITLEELAASIRAGTDVRVVDAKSGADLTQSTLAQIILESRGASRLLPVPLLVQLIRMGDEALAEFLGRYLSAALELYQQARQGAQAVAPFNPLANLPFAATNALARMLGAVQGWGGPGMEPHAPSPPESRSDDVSAMRRELDALKAELRNRPGSAGGEGGRPRPRKGGSSRAAKKTRR